MLILTNDDGGQIYIFPNIIKYFEDNTDKMNKGLHKKCNSVIYTIYGDSIFVTQTCSDIAQRLISLSQSQPK